MCGIISVKNSLGLMCECVKWGVYMSMCIFIILFFLSVGKDAITTTRGALISMVRFKMETKMDFSPMGSLDYTQRRKVGFTFQTLAASLPVYNTLFTHLQNYGRKTGIFFKYDIQQ